MIKSLLLGVTFLLFSVPAVSAFQNFNYREGQWQLEAAQQGFFTSSNYDDQGQQVGLPPSHNYKHFLLDIDASYNVTDSISILASAAGAHAESSDGVYDRTNTMMTDAGVGVQFLARTPYLWFAPQFFISVPLTTIDPNTDGVLVNEGTTQFIGRLNLLKIWSRSFQMYGSIGYDYQGEERVSLMPWNIGGRVRVKKPWIGLEFSGYRTIIPDEISPRVRQLVTNRVDGGSLRFYSTAPNLTEAIGYIEIPCTRSLVLRVAGGGTVAGDQTAQGLLYRLTLNYAFGGEQTDDGYFHIENQYRKQKARDRERLKKFKVKPDDEHQRLFEEGEDVD